jgi:hypothetical protein
MYYVTYRVTIFTVHFTFKLQLLITLWKIISYTAFIYIFNFGVVRFNCNQNLMETCMTRASTALKTRRFLSQLNVGNRIRNIYWNINNI